VENGPHVCSSVVAPIGDMHEQSTNDDIFVGNDPLPVSLSSDFVCTTTNLTGWMSRNGDFPERHRSMTWPWEEAAVNHRQGDRSVALASQVVVEIRGGFPGWKSL